MEDQNRLLAYQAIDENTKDSTVAKICKWVFEMEINGADTIRPSDRYFMDKFGWTNGTTRVAISEAKKSGFITTVGRGSARTFELNVQFLKGKMGEIVAKKPLRKTLNLEDLSVLPNNLPNNLPNKMGQNNRGENASNSNSNSNNKEHLAYASMLETSSCSQENGFSPCSQNADGRTVTPAKPPMFNDVVDLKKAKQKAPVIGYKFADELLQAAGKKDKAGSRLISRLRMLNKRYSKEELMEVARRSRFDSFWAKSPAVSLFSEAGVGAMLNKDNKAEDQHPESHDTGIRREI